MRQSLIFLSFLISLAILPQKYVQAQTEDFILGEGWTYQEHCLAEPVPPPSDWSWNGTLLLRGPYGIHGFNQDWNAPRVLAFIQDTWVISASFSPDKMWYVQAMGERECGQGMGCGYTYNDVRALQIYYLASNQNRMAYTISWNFTDLSRHTLEDITRMIWINNQEFVYGGQPSGEDSAGISLVNVETRLVSEWTGEDIINSHANNNLWSPNSAYYLRISDSGNGQQRLFLYSGDGENLEHILTATRLNSFPEMNKFDWSPNGERFLFRTWVEVENGLDLSDWYMVDIEAKTITNLCAEFFSVWSPDGESLALYWNSNLTILDSQFNHYIIRENARDYWVRHWRLAE